MTEASYALVFQGGILAGFEREQVMQRFGEMFGLPAGDVHKIFNHPRTVLKRNLDRLKADAWLNQLTGIGMAVSLDALPPPVPEPQAATGTTTPIVPKAEAVSQAEGAGAAIAAAPVDIAGEHRDLDFEFTGNGFEFFRIWIVNLLLTIVTLGIYSAWAKVRTQRYFYGNTRLDGTSFEYLANPLKILKGRLIAFAMLAIYTLGNHFFPPLSALLMLLFFLVFPWIMVRALAFRNHNSAWRGVRFGFDGRTGEAYKVFLLWPLLGMLTLGILFPYAVYRQQQFIIRNSRYGVERFDFHATAGSFYRIALAVIGVGIGGSILSVLSAMALPILGPFILIATYLTIFALSSVMMTNLRFNHTRLGSHVLRANYRLGSYALLMFTNMLAVVLTLGLFYPWARVRTARYAAQHTGLLADGDLGEFASAQRDEVSAVGGEIGDVFDMDLGF